MRDGLPAADLPLHQLGLLPYFPQEVSLTF